MTSPDSKDKSRLAELWARLSVLLGRAEPPDRAAARAEKIRMMYENFRQILAINDSTLQLIADLEDRLSGRAAFSYTMMELRVRRAVMDVFVLVKNLNQIADGRYAELYEALRRVNAAIEAESGDSRETALGALALTLSQLRSADSALAGNKMANLGEVRNGVGLPTPEGFVITTAAFARFMTHNELWEKTERLEEVLEVFGARVTAEACREVQTAIIAARFPPDMENAFFESYDSLARGRELLVAVRSSAVKEDSAATHAGQYYTELNVGRGWLLDAYRWVVASAYGLGPVSYRLEHGLTAADTPMAVGIIEMVEPGCSGILFTRALDDPEADRMVVSAVPGLNEGVTSGTANAEELVITPGREIAGAGSCLGPEDLKALSEAARRLEKYFLGPQDIEWAIDRTGRLVILQCRPLVTRKPQATDLPPLELEGDPIIEGGLTACPGMGAGPVFQVRDDADLDRFPEGAVLVATHSSPKFSRAMARCSAIVTDRGSPTGHMAILSREFSVPTIVGLEGASAALSDGRPVTVDATSRRVYDGVIMTALQQKEERLLITDTPAVQKLRRISRSVTPLNLIDPASPDFTPAHCSSLHDITRFVHEKVFEVMFRLSDRAASEQPNSLKLSGNLPYDVWVFDVGGGFADGAGAEGVLKPPDILSIPLLAFIEGLLDPRIKWDQPRALSARGFFSVLGESMAGPPAEVQGVGRASFAIVSDRYMNFSTKAGYHFNTVDTYCGKSLNKNYIHFRFAGGGAAQDRRARRCQFLSLVLGALDFKVQCRGDLLTARLEKFDRDFIRNRLADLGRLTLCSRQLDMLMDSDQSPEVFARAFLAGEFEKF